MTFPFVFFKFIPLQIVISFCRFFLCFITVSVIIIPTASAQTSTDGLKELLQDLSNVSVKLNDMNHSNDIISSEWLGASPCTLEDIRNTEQRLGITLPEDLKSFYLTSNGFLQPSYTQTSVFPIAKITRLDIEEYLGYNILKYYPRDFVNKLKSAFIIGDGDNKHQYLLLVPDTNQKSKWIYMKYGSWM
ncbi:MAG: SMI1/KNR4 family protein, partial [Candidatus Kapabacteria bacterium]|nr:SMI1/KNR4 family protein [Candidatus Kapabacteria bacterium]